MTKPRYRRIDFNGREADRLLQHHWQEMSESQLNLLIHQSLQGFAARLRFTELKKNGWHAFGQLRILK